MISHEQKYNQFLTNIEEKFPLFQGIDFPRLLVSSTTCSIPKNTFQQIQDFIKIIQKLSQNPIYIQKTLLSLPPDMATLQSANKGVFTTCDFFNTEKGLKLIEINTNGGGFLIALLQQFLANPTEKKNNDILPNIKKIFLNEYELATGKKNPSTIVICDENPTQQGLYSEMLGFQRLFNSFGWHCDICDPNDIIIDESSKKLKTKSGQKIDIIYNRHCDFYLNTPALAAIKEATIAKQVCLTPNPFNYALFADKQRLIDLTTADFLDTVSLSETEQNNLNAIIPKSIRMNTLTNDDIHQNKAAYFFKPINSFGSKGVYSGKSISHTKIDSLNKDNYLLQPLLIPSKIHINDNNDEFKQEIRVFFYNDQIQLITNRLYKGQVNNAQSEGGGFAAMTIQEI